jgi:hypothetical protein
MVLELTNYVKHDLKRHPQIRAPAVPTLIRSTRYLPIHVRFLSERDAAAGAVCRAMRTDRIRADPRAHAEHV